MKWLKEIVALYKGKILMEPQVCLCAVTHYTIMTVHVHCVTVCLVPQGNIGFLFERKGHPSEQKGPLKSGE